MSQSPRRDRTTKKKVAEKTPRVKRVADAARSTKSPPTGRTPKPAARPARPLPKPTANGSAKNGHASTTRKPVPAKSTPTPAARATPSKPAARTPSKPTPAAAKAAPAPKKPEPAAKSPAPAKPAASPAKPAPATKSAPVPIPPRPEYAIPADKDIAAKSARNGNTVKDQIILTVPDPFWLHAYWQLSVQSVQRAEAALGQDWHGAKPILRLYDVTSTDTTSTSEAPIRDIVIHGGCSHWYIDIPQPPRSYRADIGYLTRTNRFFPISRSNVVMPPKAGTSEALEENWTENIDEKMAERIITSGMTTENGTGRESPNFNRTPPAKEPFGSGAVLPGKLKKFFFEIDAQLIVFGRTDPTAAVTLQNEPVALRPDGTFTMRYPLPDSRQIIPAVATSTDGMEEQTIVLAIERNTKRLDPMIHDLYGDT